MDKCIERVLSLPQLTPSEEVNAAFTELVDAVVAHGEEPLLCYENRRHQVQQRCAVAEGELERHWSRRIAGADNPWSELKEFPYHENYKELTRREIGLLGRAGLWLCDSSEVAMIGSGPLPLTGWWLHQLTEARITHIDASNEAIELSRGLAAALDWPGKFVTGLGQSVALDEGQYDAIYVAGLAGETLAEKQAIVDHVLPALKPDDGRLIARGAYGARTLLYPGFDAHAFEGVQLMEEYHPTDGVINSVFVYKQAA
jgi:nicotianamine synthase 2